MRILLVEDERKMAQLLKKGLEEEGYSVLIAHDGQQGLSMAQSCTLDGIILDIMMPKLSGLEVASRLRRAGNSTPILMLTARDANPDIVKGLNTGADDYLTKPFAFEVLLARLRALMRRGAAPRPVDLRVADLVLDPATHLVSRGKTRILLTKKEYALLECLMRRARTVVPRSVLIDEVWGFEGDIENNTLDAFIRLLRTKIDSGFEPKLASNHSRRGVLLARGGSGMKFHSIGFRLTLWYFVILALALAAFGAAMWSGLRRSMYAAIDDTLRDRARGVGKFIEIQGQSMAPEEMRDEFREHSVLGPGGDVFQVADGCGNWLYRSNFLIDSAAPVYSAESLKAGRR
jgi:DNA-binding response OmpR family regulator